MIYYVEAYKVSIAYLISLGSGDIASSSQEKCKFGWLSKLIACICIMELELN